MVLDSDKIRASKVLASARALGLNVHDVDLHRALQSHNAPHDQVFDKNINSSARLFMRNVAKHKATPKVVKATPHSVSNSPVAPRVRTCVLLVDSDRLRRDDLTAAMSSRFKVVVASSLKDALQVLQMLKVHVVLARLRYQKDSAIDLIHACREKHMTVPVALYTSCVVGYEAMLAECVDAGACGFFEDTLPPEILCFRLLDMTKSFHATDAEWRDFKPPPSSSTVLQHHRVSTSHPAARHHKVSARSLLSPGGFRRSSKMPSNVENGDMAARSPTTNTSDVTMTTLDMQIQDRQTFLAKQEHIQKVMTIQHSVLGLNDSRHHIRSSKPNLSVRKEPRLLNPDLVRREVPEPSHDQIVQCMYTHPHVVATLVQHHDYDVRTRPPRDPVPQEPLLTHCLIVDPSTLCDSKAVLKRINRGYLALEAGHFDRAIRWCTLSLKMEPNHLPKWCLLIRGSVHDLLGAYEAAVNDFESAISIDPTFHQAHFNKSVSLLKLGKDDAALDAVVAAQAHVVGKAARSRPVPPEYVRNHALILRRMGRYDDARVVYATLDVSTGGSTAATCSIPSNPPIETPILGASTGPVCLDETVVEKEQSLEEHMLGKAGLPGSVFDALFCQSKDDKAACRAAPQTRTPAMLDLLQSRLYQYDYFAHCPEPVLRNVCQALHHVVVRSGDTFYLGHDNPHAFYVCMSGTLSVHANLTLAGQDVDTMASSSTHRLRPGDVFGCVGVSISSLMMYLADERTEIMYLTPSAFKDTLEAHWLMEQHARFNVLRRSPAFQVLSDSELGHVVSHSNLVRFHKGDVVVAQNEFPKRLYVLYKGICRVEQSFSLPADDCDNNPSRRPSVAQTSPASTGMLPSTPVKPYHRYLEIPNWPLGFRTHQKAHSTNALLTGHLSPINPSLGNRPGSPCQAQVPITALSSPPPPLPTITHDIYPPALFGESAYKTVPEKAKCSIVASTLVEVLAVDMHQLKSLNVAKELFAAVVANAPIYVDEAKASKMQASHAQWAAKRGKEALQVNKTRWPVNKARLRYIPNGGSIVVPDGNIVSAHHTFK
ncbi:hypothetical protein, variant [Aphanomyces astaci]|uniref:Cyclic nucleotide-binding domain-containing protein n=1 Tax=Aphanomyces astaci TaxID=112090 RepID=W4H550_APHAT|nr:hypothetical protein, variant [Aphanomyces astaci]ETV86394.1 hypothetical protein, variant [Aphanomyces astaci]|eukprot:XP_009824866.1 hypothetical protein, variant [Aphanomyces astaci]